MPHPAHTKPHQTPAPNPGDRIAAVTLSWGGPGAMPHRYHAGKAQLEKEFNLQLIEMPHTLKPPEWIAKNPQSRADDLMQAFADPTIRTIVSTIGGNDSVRILPHLNLDIIRQNPKIFLGYSDSTITHLACHKANLVSFYGPSVMSGFAENTGMFPYMIRSLRKTLFSTTPIGLIPPNTEGWTVEHLRWEDPANQNKKRALNPSTGWRFLQGIGTATGPLIGGCAETLEILKGTPWWPTPQSFHNAILFLETSQDAPPPIYLRDWLRNYAAQGILQNLAGLLVGRPGGANLSPADYERYDQVILQIIRDELALTNLPIITRMDFGHTDPILTLPIGLPATINCDKQTLEINESAIT